MRRLFVAMIFMIATTARAEVWPSKNHWNDNWEKIYSNWVATKFNPDTFRDDQSPYYNLKMNCADFIYVVRAIFSYENNLEFAMNDSAMIFSSTTRELDSIKDPISRANHFFKIVMQKGSIRTLASDSFLVSVKDIRSGDFLLASPERIHSWLIWKINEYSNPTLLYATEPADSLILENYGYPSTSEFFEGASKPGQGGLGIRRFRWPEELKLRSVSRSSNDQLNYQKENFFEDIQKDIVKKPTDPSDEIAMAVDNVCVLAQARVNAVLWARYLLEDVHHGRPFSQSEYELHSTEHRDLELKASFQYIDAIHSAHSKELTNLGERYYQAVISEAGSYCQIHWNQDDGNDRQEPIGKNRRKSLADCLSPNPNDSVFRRWGELGNLQKPQCY